MKKSNLKNNKVKTENAADYANGAERINAALREYIETKLAMKKAELALLSIEVQMLEASLSLDI